MNRETEDHTSSIPNFDIIDLDNDGADSDSETTVPADHAGKRHFRINMHIVLLIVCVAVVLGIAYRIMNFGVFVDLDEIFKDGQGTYEDTLDEFFPLMDSSGQILDTNKDEELTIVAFGNAPFAEDRDSEDNLANMIAEMTGATVYNCSISGSYLASESPNISTSDFPMDVYTFYWLSILATGNHIMHVYEGAEAVLGEDTPPEAAEVLNTLTTLDFNTVDVVVILYDATDYLMGHEMYNDQNPTDIQQFTGNLEAGIEAFQSVYPHIRIIVLSPPYAFSDQLDEKGNYISSDIARYGQDVLSTYVIKQYSSCAERGVTFVDNLYGTITEDNADEYLIDNLHLNAAGRKKIAERFVYALQYFD